ncbi:MAG: hypothetical protein WA696_15735 [Solirubrobacterales bacterium]
MATALAAGVFACLWATPALGRSVTLVALPQGTTVGELTRAGLSPGVMSAGIGPVPGEQTYLDIAQGNRVDEALYDRSLPPVRSIGARVPNWEQIVQRADGAPAEIVPGLLASSLVARGIRSAAVPTAGPAALLAARRDGVVGADGGTVTVISAGVGVTGKLVTGLAGDGLIIAFASPPPRSDRALPIGIAGRGFGGDLTSDSTRSDGYVLSTDIAPTILRWLGVPVPSQMDGQPIRSEGEVDPGAVEDLAERMAAIPTRRAPVVIASLLAWIVVTALVALIARSARRAAQAWLALAFAFMPLMLLAGAAIEPSALVEGLLVGFGAGALAVLTLLLVRGWWALAVACAITVVAYAIDVIAGSPLTKLSLLGPNPVFGVRFFGIGNELEALIAVMVPVGVAAGLSAAGERSPVTRPVAIAGYLVAAGLAALVFAAGRFGADVGAAIVLPVGAAVAVATLPTSGGIGTRRRRALALALVIAAPLSVLALLAFIDLVSGGNSHLTRSVLDAGGAGDLADVAQRRLELSAHDFAQAAGNPLFWIVIVGIAVAATRLRRIDAWLRPVPAVRSGLIGACAAVAAGVLVNDSGATFLTLGALALGAALAFAWAQTPMNDP